MPSKKIAAWRQKADPLWRGDNAAGVSLPDPTADPSLVRHILFLEGAGRPTPFHSTTEDHAVAKYFAGSSGKVFQTGVARAAALKIKHISRLELLRLLRGKGQGRAAWSSPMEVMQARRYVEERLEHLLDFTDLSTLAPAEVSALVAALYV